MEYKYKVEFILKRKPVVVFARQLEKYDFELGLSPQLNGCPIKRELQIPRKLKEDGSPDYNIFCFLLENGNDADKFVEGEIVELQP